MGKGVKDMVHIDYMMPFENGSFHAHYLNLAKKSSIPKNQNLFFACHFSANFSINTCCTYVQRGLMGLKGSLRNFQEMDLIETTQKAVPRIIYGY